MWHRLVSLLFCLINQSSHPSFNSSLPRPSSRVNPSSLVFKLRCFCGDIFVLLRAPRVHPQAPILDRSRPQSKSYCFRLGGRASTAPADNDNYRGMPDAMGPLAPSPRGATKHSRGAMLGNDEDIPVDAKMFLANWGFTHLLEKDQATHGVKDYKLDNENFDEFQESVGNIIDAGAIDAATSAEAE
ncbi:hypothetical protein FB451DRAFT_1380810 [Mycena latifolia]|nr:hypothetical protein FB451DRAFT_1380810 [Mycena latifolia]